MRAVRFTKAEVAAIRACMTGGAPDAKSMSSVLRKLEEAEAEAPVGVNASAIEAALESTARGKVVRLVGGGLYARASKQATSVGATVEGARAIGAWLARQGWLREPVTVLTVLNKWGEWLPRALATAPPPAAREGFDGETGSGAPGESPRGGGRGRAPGFK